ncbi:MAG: hypothetical protein Q8S31_05590 [Alphaproteobacteria bacterium]|nr:hypothetical protein [Alphaproteobacteria bacterium]
MKKFYVLFLSFFLNFSLSNAHEINESCCECDECALDDIEEVVEQIKSKYTSIVKEQEKSIPIRLSMQAQGPYAVENYKYLKFKNNHTGEIITPSFIYVDGRIEISAAHLTNISESVSFNYILEIPGKQTFEELCFSKKIPNGLFGITDANTDMLQAIRFSVIDMPDRFDAPIKVTILGSRYAPKDIKTEPLHKIDGFKLHKYTGALHDEILIIQASETYPYADIVDDRLPDYVCSDDEPKALANLKYLRICEYIRLVRLKYSTFGFNNKAYQTILLNVFREYGWINASDFSYIKEQLGWD